MAAVEAAGAMSEIIVESNLQGEENAVQNDEGMCQSFERFSIK